jgi:hypothetical protein
VRYGLTGPCGVSMVHTGGLLPPAGWTSTVRVAVQVLPGLFPLPLGWPSTVTMTVFGPWAT